MSCPAVQEDTSSYSDLSPSSLGEILLGCNKQDITRRGSKKAKHHVLMILPQHFAFDSSSDHEVGVLEDANSSSPTLVIKSTGGTLRYTGRFISTSTSFFMLDCFPNSQSVMSDMYQYVLVFDGPVVERQKGSSSAEDGATSGEVTSNWVSQHGMSALVPGKKLSASKKSQLSKAKAASRGDPGDGGSVAKGGVEGDRDESPGASQTVRPTRRQASQSSYCEDSGEEDGDSYFSTSSLSDPDDQSSDSDFEEQRTKKRRRK